MPPIDQPVPKAKAKKPPKVRVTRPDAGDETRTRKPAQPTVKVRMYAHPERNTAQNTFRTARTEQVKAREHRAEVKRAVSKIHVTPVASPDARDSLRSPAQKARDTAAAQQSVQSSRVKALREQQAGSGTRAVVNYVKTNVADEKKAKTTDAHGHGAGKLALVEANLPVGGFSLKMLKNGFKDAAELAVTTPSSVAKLASDVVHHPKKVPGELVKPYLDLAKNPLKTAEEKPVSTALMLQPVGRVPGRVVGRVARATGKQTLERAPATLPHTALQEARIGSRDAALRSAQARRDAAAPEPTITAKEVQRRVDEHYDHAKHESHRIIGEHVKAAKKATKGQPKDARTAAVEAAREQGRQVADAVAQERFAREFGANERLSHGHVQRDLLHRERRSAVARADTAREAARVADAVHGAALTAAKVARARVKSSPTLAALEAHRGIAVKAVVDAQKAAGKAREAHSNAIGRAQVLSRNVTGRSTPNANGVWAAGGHGVRLAKEQVDTTAQAVKDARARVKEFDQRIADERQRISGVPPAEHQALTDAIHARGAAQAAFAQARAAAHAAAHEHIAAKKAMTNATLVSPAKEGRLFAHKADAATLVKKLNQATTDPEATFVLHQVGEDRWAAVPKVARQRLYGSGGKLHMGHFQAGQGKATGARLMRVSRQAFTNATLPVSLKWLGGQGAEAGVRAAVAGAGPLDWLRMGKVVKKLNEQRPGAGDELASRLTGGQFGLTGPARDFAHGKSLAEELEGTARPVEKAANAASAVGRTLPARAIKHGWREYTGFVFGKMNHLIEQNARRAMAGQAIKNLGFDEQHINGLADKAIEDAANRLHGTHNQVALGRALNDMYGKYSGFSPEMRSLLAHWTPFLPWYLNTVHFLFKTLPIDHPVKAALLADVSQATEQWRKDHGLSLLQGGHVPSYLLGSYPKGDGLLRVAHYTPWGVGADPTGAAGDLLLPQVMGPVGNMKFGVDWKGDPLTRGGSYGPKFNTGEKFARAVVTGLEEQVPLVSQAGKVSGLTPRYIDKDSPENIKSPGTVLKSYLPTTPSSSGGASSGGTSGTASQSSSARVKIPGVGSGRVKLPGGATGRIKVP